MTSAELGCDAAALGATAPGPHGTARGPHRPRSSGPALGGDLRGRPASPRAGCAPPRSDAPTQHTRGPGHWPRAAHAHLPPSLSRAAGRARQRTTAAASSTAATAAVTPRRQAGWGGGLALLRQGAAATGPGGVGLALARPTAWVTAAAPASLATTFVGAQNPIVPDVGTLSRGRMRAPSRRPRATLAQCAPRSFAGLETPSHSRSRSTASPRTSAPAPAPSAPATTRPR
jgi:hypothetical protein